MRKLPTRAQAVDGRGAHSKPVRDRGHGEQGALDPSWTRVKLKGWALSGAPWRIGNPGLPNCQVRSVGLTMQDEELLVFGNPRAGTPLMVARPLVGLELPLRMLVWRNAEGWVRVSYEESAVIGRVQRNNQPSV